MLEIVDRIERQMLVQRRGRPKRYRPLHYAKREAVRLGARYVLASDVAGCAYPVFHDHGLSQGILQLLGIEAYEQIDTGTCRCAANGM